MTEEIRQFKAIQFKGLVPEFPNFNELGVVRTYFRRAGYLGVQKGVAYGNMSWKPKDLEIGEFILIGTQTSRKSSITKDDLVLILDCSFKTNLVEYAGKIEPSTEALTHTAIYWYGAENGRKIGAVIHAHHALIWKYMLDNDYLRTGSKAKAGTLELVKEIQLIMEVGSQIGFAMEGHKNGIWVYGEDLHEVRDILDELLGRAMEAEKFK